MSSLSHDFTFDNTQLKVTLEQTDNASLQALTINGKSYRVIGSDDAVHLFHSRLQEMPSSDFATFNDLEVSLRKSGPVEPTASVFQHVVKPTAHLFTEHWIDKDLHVKMKVAEHFWAKVINQNSKEGYSDFLNYLGFIAKYDPTITQETVKAIEDALGAKNRAGFLALFATLPQGIVTKIDEFEKLHTISDVHPPIASPVTLTDDTINALREYMKRTGFSGVIALSDGKKTEIIVSKQVASPDAPFAIHSIGKVFTGVLVIRLMQDGIVEEKALTEPIKLAPEVWDKLPLAVREHLQGKDAPTLHQVMTHKAKLGDYLDKYRTAIDESQIKATPLPVIESPEQFLEYADKTIFENDYSNLGLLLVGLSLQHMYNAKKNCNRTYQEILDEYVIQQASLHSFSSQPPKGACFNENDPVASKMAGGPAGGYWISAADLLKFGEWIGKKYKEDPKFQLLVNLYGQEFHPEPQVIAHSGSIDSSDAFLTHYNLGGLTVSILSNRPYQARVINGAIRDLTTI